ncbi:hypothetical protein AWJ20_3421 [Sugiyamaella lignohabitans]|uniref:SIS domain-containing protein n=1 Tax=Sugiyamaella lignohabitans TaxID=796027 RepID=A0A161HNN2_9ASCO|nr:uncharacterized protein AWJ20_3421 [Sugiyamaella lignohabitans]ANB15777.1 hypothetical protein AWJ20_3421 [Sugiyamaella lignohabitans]
MIIQPAKINLTHLQTECQNPLSSNLDVLTTLEIVQLMNKEDVGVVSSVSNCVNDIAAAADDIYPRIASDGRLFYVGAGSSGRLGVLDAAEIPPTFSASPSQFVGIISGGDRAIRITQEGAEDDVESAIADLKHYNLSPLDTVIGIASSGRTPYVLSALNFAKTFGCLTVGICCVSPSAMQECDFIDHLVAPVTGPEVVTGSTRLKAGTATKMVLNMLSTTIMVKLGKTYGNLMVDLKPSNLKLKERSKKIFRTICGTKFYILSENGGTRKIYVPNSDEDNASQIVGQHIASCENDLKLAIIVGKTGLNLEESKRLLHNSLNRLGLALGSHRTNFFGPRDRSNDEQSDNESIFSTNSDDSDDSLSSSIISTANSENCSLVLVVDGGGSKTAVVIKCSSGIEVQCETGSSNIASCGVDGMIDAVGAAIRLAVSKLPPFITVMNPKSLQIFDSVWIGIAGISSTKYEKVLDRFEEFLGLPRNKIRLTGDSSLLAAVLSYKPEYEAGISLVSGTGSGAVAYKYYDNQYECLGRAGGWGSYLGDEGSGYYIGMQAIKDTIAYLDRKKLGRVLTSSTVPKKGKLVELSKFQKKLIRYMGNDGGDEDMFLTDMIEFMSSNDIDNSTRKAKIADVTRIVFEAAFSEPRDDKAYAIAQNAASVLVKNNVLPFTEEGLIDPGQSLLIFAGSLLCNGPFQDLVLAALDREGIHFKGIEVVEHPAQVAAKGLLCEL